MAESSQPLRDPWLLAVWPGMGSVALLAGSFLLQQLRAIPAFELDSSDYFEIETVDVKHGIATMGRLPRNVFFEWRDPRNKHDLLVFVGEAQPESGGFTLAQEIVQYAASRGVKKLFTFAAMATQLHPGNTPRTFAVATNELALNDAKKTGADVLAEGQIIGLNGILLGVGADKGITGVCLLGELPYFAVGVPNPAAAHAVLEHFIQLAGINIDLTELRQQAELVEGQLQQLMEKMQASIEDEDELPISDEESSETEEEPPAANEPQLDPRQTRRIENLFEQAKRDKGKAFELKRELDRLGIFKKYEDRFLDLFRHAG